MDTDVAAFAKQLRQDGIDAARADAERILGEARREAAEILRRAHDDAEATKTSAREAVEKERQRFAVEIGIAARDAMLKTRREIEGVVMRLLRAKVGDALATDEVVRAAIVEVIRNPDPGGAREIAVGPRIGKALVEATVSELFKGREGAIAVVEEFGLAGLEIRTGEGAEVIELTEESVAEVFRQMLSPELTRLIDTLPG